jgi:hypothetical protein
VDASLAEVGPIRSGGSPPSPAWTAEVRTFCAFGGKECFGQPIANAEGQRAQGGGALGCLGGEDPTLVVEQGSVIELAERCVLRSSGSPIGSRGCQSGQPARRACHGSPSFPISIASSSRRTSGAISEATAPHNSAR